MALGIHRLDGVLQSIQALLEHAAGLGVRRELVVETLHQAGIAGEQSGNRLELVLQNLVEFLVVDFQGAVFLGGDTHVGEHADIGTLPRLDHLVAHGGEQVAHAAVTDQGTDHGSLVVAHLGHAGQFRSHADQLVVGLDELLDVVLDAATVLLDRDGDRLVGVGDRLQLEGDAVDDLVDRIGRTFQGQAVDAELGVPGLGDVAAAAGGRTVQLGQGQLAIGADAADVEVLQAGTALDEHVLAGAGILAGEDQSRGSVSRVVDDVGGDALVLQLRVERVAHFGEGRARRDVYRDAGIVGAPA